MVDKRTSFLSGSEWNTPSLDVDLKRLCWDCLLVYDLPHFTNLFR
jgi:hypothetical protein